MKCAKSRKVSLKCAKIQLLIVRAGSSHGCQLRPALHRAGSVRQVDRAGKGPAKVLIDLGPSQTVSGESVRLAGPGTTTDDASLGKPKLNDVGAMVAFGPEIIPLLPVVVPVMAIMQVFPGEKVLLHKDVSVVAHVGENVAVDPGKLKSAQAQFRKSLRAVEMFSCFSYAAGAPAPNGDLDGAIKGCQQALVSEPNSFYLPYLHFKTASLFLEKRDFVHAIPEYRTVVQLDPKDERFRIGLVNALEDSGDLDTAFVEIKEAIRLWLDWPYFHYLLGR